MAHSTRPDQISTLLKAMSLDGNEKSVTILKEYIVNLEAKQPDRPFRITQCLEEVELHYSAEAKASLEAYISELEANQQPVPPTKTQPPTESPYWRSVRREKERKIRALRKQESHLK